MDYQTLTQTILNVIYLLGIIFAIYIYFRTPQEKAQLITSKLSEDVKDLQRQITDVRETHLKSVETDLKTLTSAVNQLSITVATLSTIINERIPRAMPNLGG